MSWLSRFLNGSRSAPANNVEGSEPEAKNVSEDLFVEKLNQSSNQSSLKPELIDVKGIYRVYAYLRQDFEEKGFSDSFSNSDLSYMQSNIELIREDLATLIEEVQTEYQDFQRTLNFHIDSRSRAGLVDTVEELKSDLARVEDHLDKIEDILQKSKEEKGLSVRATLSYRRGFMKGLASLSQSQINNR